MEVKRIYTRKNREMSKFFYWIGILVVITSCGKDVDLFIPRSNQAEIGDLNRLTTRLKEDIAGNISYVVPVGCHGDQVFEVDKDLVIGVPADFVDLSEFPCQNGGFELHITACDTKGEILIAGIPTISEGKLLESRIEINLQIRQGSTVVKLAKGKQIIIKVNDPDPRERMELFYGNDDNSEWLQADNDPVAWDNVTNGEWVIQDSFNTIFGSGYETLSDSIDWINIDVFFEIMESQRTDVCISLPAEFSNTNTAVYMVFNDYNSIVELYGDAEVRQFCEPYFSTPLGFNVTFIAISEMGEDCYLFAKKTTSITSHHTEYLTPVKTPYEEIKNFILEL